MAKVTGLTAEKIIELDTVALISARIDAVGNLLLTTRSGNEFNVGQIYDGGVYFGNDAPASTLGANRDTFINVSNARVYHKNSSGWVEKVQLVTKLTSDLGLYYAGVRLDKLEAAIPGIQVTRTSSFTMPTPNQTFVPYDTTIRATGGMTLTGWGGVTVPRTGWYNVSANITFASSTSSARRILGIATTATAGSMSTIRGAVSRASAQDTANFSILSTTAQIYATEGHFIYASAFSGTSWALDVDSSYKNMLTVSFSGQA